MFQNKSSANLLPKVKSAHIPWIEVALLLILLILGFSFRAWELSNIGLDHFDEGVYAFSALGITDPSQPLRLYPEQIKFSPPMFFSLIGLSYYFFGGPSDTAAIFVNVLLGTLTIAIVWWVGRTWFGKPAGVAAATLLTFSEYHIALSRSALTDVTFAFFFVVALAAITNAFKRQSIGAAILAGLTVGLAWSTKYHGWFALLISGIALLLFSWHQRTNGALILRSFSLWFIIALVAVVCYLPWALYIQSQPGEYAELAQYQRTMLSIDWFRNLWQHIQMQFFFEGTLSRLSVLIALFCALLASSGRSSLTNLFLLILGLLSFSASSVGGSGTTVLLVLLAIPALLRKPVVFQSWLVLIWLAVFFFSTPLYHPYARLLLPFTIATYLVSGFWMSKILNESQQELRSIDWRYISVAIGTIAIFILSILLPDSSNPWRQSKSVAKAARAMEEIIPSGSRVIVIGEPALAYYLHLANRPAFERTNDSGARIIELEKLHTPVYVVTGVYSNRAPSLRERLKRLGNRLILLKTFAMDPKDIRVLDDFVPRDARLFRQNPDQTYNLRLYRFSP